MRIKPFLACLCCVESNWLLVHRDLGGIRHVAWIWPTTKFRSYFHFSFPFALAFLGFVSSLYLFTLISWVFYTCAAIFASYVIELASDGLCSLGNLSFHALHFSTPFISPPSYPSIWESGWPHQSVCPGPHCPGSKGVWLVVSPPEPESKQLERPTAAKLQ